MRLAAVLLSACAMAQVPFETFDLNAGETAPSRHGAVWLVSWQVKRDTSAGAVREAWIEVRVAGKLERIECGNYNLPKTVGPVQIDCPVLGEYPKNANGNLWAIEKHARIRVWPAGSPWMTPGAFAYPVKQRWFATATQMSNEPTFIDGGDTATRKAIYYHTGLDIGGAEGFTPVVAATDGLIVSLGNARLPGHDAPVVNPRYDVIYLLDSRGWYYRYSHLHSFNPSLKLGAKVIQGQDLGLLGKEGGSGGWSHLHFEAYAKQPSGRYGTLDAYAFLWEAYLRDYQPPVIAVARPHRFVKTGERVTIDASKSWAKTGIRRFRWKLSDGTEAQGPSLERTYAKPGTYSELVEAEDERGNVARDSAIVQVIDAADPAAPYPSLHLSYFPSLDARAGEPITFQARSFLQQYPQPPGGEEKWDFGDGATGVTRSDGNREKLNPQGYARIAHTYAKPGRYLVKVEREGAAMYLDVVVR